MARPIKQTVDYFPHQVSKGKTKLILQNEFGNDGYAFWFQLLELLCVSDNQVYDYNNLASWRLLLAETHVTEDNAIKILQLLADLGAIDAELHKNKIIWSQNLVENLELVYKRRATGTPEKPVIANKNAINVNKNRQTKLNNTKLNNTKYIPYPEYPNVNKMTREEHQKLIEKFGEAGARDRVENLSLYIASKGDKYKNHYATILAWEKRDRKGGQDGEGRGYSKKTTDEQRRASIG
ncbi:hypothetical protein ES703_75307 [subsurface metagenome]